MRQARRAIAGLEDDGLLQHLERRQGLVRLALVDQQLRRIPLGVTEPLLQHMGEKIAGLFERPRPGVAREGFEVLQHERGLERPPPSVNRHGRDQAVPGGWLARASRQPQPPQ